MKALIFEQGRQLVIRGEGSEEINYHEGRMVEISNQTYEDILFSTPDRVQFILQQIIGGN